MKGAPAKEVNASVGRIKKKERWAKRLRVEGTNEKGSKKKWIIVSV